jgi:hypothetical protein
MKHQLFSNIAVRMRPIACLLSCKKENKTFPLKGTYSTVNEQLSSPLCFAKNNRHRQSTLLGQSTFIAFSTLNLTTPPPFKLGGTSTSYAANGDVFYTSFTGTATPNPNGTMSLVISHTITGGTGRFNNAGEVLYLMQLRSQKPHWYCY